MQLIEFLFSNPLFIIIALGLINVLFSKSKKREKQNEESKMSRPPRPVKQHQRQRRPERQQSEVTEKVELKSVEQLHAKQMERLSQTIQRNDSDDSPTAATASMEKNLLRREDSFSNVDFKKEMKARLTKKGLVESVVMAEVLGPPRSLNPYRSVTTKRKGN